MTNKIKYFWFAVIILLASKSINGFDPDFSDSETSDRILVKEGMPHLTVMREFEFYVHINETSSNAGNTSCWPDAGQTNIKLPTEWRRLKVNYSSDRTNTIFGIRDDRYTINCTAPYLTRWTSSILPWLPSIYGHSSRYDHNPFVLEEDLGGATNASGKVLTISFSSQFSVMLANASSGYVQCESVENASLATRIFFSLEEGFPFVKIFKDKEFQPPIITDTRKDFYVPCVANYQKYSAKLVRVTNFSCNVKYLVEKDDVSPSEILTDYDPQNGFLVKGNNLSEQHYRCKSPLEARWHQKQRILRDFYNPYVENNNISLQFNIGSTEDEFPLGIWCSTGNDVLNQIQMISCSSQYECDWISGCFYSGLSRICNIKIKMQSAIPFQRKFPNSKQSGTITKPFTRGKVKCVSTLNPAVIAYEYLFLGLDRHRYWLLAQSNEIPKRAIIYLTETESILYTNKPAKFACEIANFVLLSNIKFAAVFKNGSNFLLDKINATRDPAILIDNDLGFSRKEIVTNITVEMIGIMCWAPWLNSSKWISTTRTFEVKDLRAPSILSSSNETNTNVASEKISYVTFYEGDKTRSLYCNASGEPQPSIKWVIPPEHNSTFVPTHLDRNTLHFPTIDSSLQGKYNCIATNDIGSDFLVFDVAVKPPNPRLETVEIIGIAATFVVLLIGIVFSVKKYFDAKKKTRDLTPDEVKEFLYGNPDVLKDVSAGIVTEDGIQSMAFNPEYEISASDLSLDESSTLGEGQFGKVLQGSLRDKVVAVKTAKPNADISYFLALLSELKIMAYIAKDKHPNIIQFFGAVVSEIQRRKVFVVVELSTIGNLQNVLVKMNSYEFLDLINEDESLKEETSLEQINQVASTLNMISWCQQIASGMEFLASKRLIHGDLATRNILMFDNGVVKITDFGLSRKLYESPQYVKKNKVAMPVAWMAIESLRFMQFSSQSDVWSFAVTVWEIFSMGEIPYAGIPSNDFVKNLLSGIRLDKPTYASNDIHTMLLRCWELEPSQRPSFAVIHAFFTEYSKTIIENLEENTNKQNITPEEALTNAPDSERMTGGYHTFGAKSFLVQE